MQVFSFFQAYCQFINKTQIIDFSIYFLQEAKKLIDDTSLARRDLDTQVRRLQDELDEQRRKYEEAVRARSGDREKIDDLLVQLSNLESELSLLKRRISLLEEELGRLRKENSRLQVKYFKNFDFSEIF